MGYNTFPICSPLDSPFFWVGSPHIGPPNGTVFAQGCDKAKNISALGSI